MSTSGNRTIEILRARRRKRVRRRILAVFFLALILTVIFGTGPCLRWWIPRTLCQRFEAGTGQRLEIGRTSGGFFEALTLHDVSVPSFRVRDRTIAFSADVVATDTPILRALFGKETQHLAFEGVRIVVGAEDGASSAGSVPMDFSKAKRELLDLVFRGRRTECEISSGTLSFAGSDVAFDAAGAISIPKASTETVNARLSFRRGDETRVDLACGLVLDGDRPIGEAQIVASAFDAPTIKATLGAEAARVPLASLENLRCTYRAHRGEPAVVDAVLSGTWAEGPKGREIRRGPAPWFACVLGCEITEKEIQRCTLHWSSPDGELVLEPRSELRWDENGIHWGLVGSVKAGQHVRLREAIATVVPHGLELGGGVELGFDVKGRWSDLPSDLAHTLRSAESGTYTLRAHNASFSGFHVEDLLLDFDARNEERSLRGLSAKSSDGRILGRGVWPLSGNLEACEFEIRTEGDIAFDGPIRHGVSMSAVFGGSLRCRALAGLRSFEASLHIPRASIALPDGSIRGFSDATCEVRGAIRPDTPDVTLQSFLLRTPRERLSLQEASVGARDEADELSGVVDARFDVGWISESLKREIRPRGAVSVRGPLTLSFGPGGVRVLRGRADLSVDHLEALGQELASVTTTVEVEDSRFNCKSFRAEIGLGSSEGEMEFLAGDGGFRSRFDLQLKEAPLAFSWSSDPDGGSRVEGVVSGRVRFREDGTSWDSEVLCEVRDIVRTKGRMAPTHASSGRIEGSIRMGPNGELELSDLKAGVENLDVSVDRALIRRGSQWPETLRGRILGESEIARLFLPNWLPTEFLLPGPFRTTFDVDVKPPFDPENARIDLELRAAGLEAAGIRLPGIDLKLKLAEGRVVIERFLSKTASGTAALIGELGIAPGTEREGDALRLSFSDYDARWGEGFGPGEVVGSARLQGEGEMTSGQGAMTFRGNVRATGIERVRRLQGREAQRVRVPDLLCEWTLLGDAREPAMKSAELTIRGEQVDLRVRTGVMSSRNADVREFRLDVGQDAAEALLLGAHRGLFAAGRRTSAAGDFYLGFDDNGPRLETLRGKARFDLETGMLRRTGFESLKLELLADTGVLQVPSLEITVGDGALRLLEPARLDLTEGKCSLQVAGTVVDFPLEQLSPELRQVIHPLLSWARPRDPLRPVRGLISGEFRLRTIADVGLLGFSSFDGDGRFVLNRLILPGSEFVRQALVQAPEALGTELAAALSGLVPTMKSPFEDVALENEEGLALEPIELPWQLRAGVVALDPSVGFRARTLELRFRGTSHLDGTVDALVWTDLLRRTVGRASANDDRIRGAREAFLGLELSASVKGNLSGPEESGNDPNLKLQLSEADGFR